MSNAQPCEGHYGHNASGNTKSSKLSKSTHIHPNGPTHHIPNSGQLVLGKLEPEKTDFIKSRTKDGTKPTKESSRRRRRNEHHEIFTSRLPKASESNNRNPYNRQERNGSMTRTNNPVYVTSTTPNRSPRKEEHNALAPAIKTRRHDLRLKHTRDAIVVDPSTNAQKKSKREYRITDYDHVLKAFSNFTGSRFEVEIQGRLKLCVRRSLLTESRIHKNVPIRVAPPPVKGTIFCDTHERFMLMRILGSGNSGDVYEVREESTGHRRAMKVIRFCDTKTFTTSTVCRLLKELSFHSLLNQYDPHHECGVPRFRSLVLPEQFVQPYIGAVMPLCSVGLDNVMNSQKGHMLHITGIIAILQQIVKSLDVLHRRCGIVHGDLKASNIMLEPRKGWTLTSELTVCNDDRRDIFQHPVMKKHLDTFCRINAAFAKAMNPDDRRRHGKVVIEISAHQLPGSTQNTAFKTANALRQAPPRRRGNDFRVRLIDLGASVVGDHFERGMRVCGTFHLKPPEDLYGYDNRDLVYKRDIWALGLLALNLWCGHPYQPHKNKLNLLPHMERLTDAGAQLRARTRLALSDPSNAFNLHKTTLTELMDYELGLCPFISYETLPYQAFFERPRKSASRSISTIDSIAGRGGHSQSSTTRMGMSIDSRGPRMPHLMESRGDLGTTEDAGILGIVVLQRMGDFVQKCLQIDPADRPSAQQLAMHPLFGC